MRIFATLAPSLLTVVCGMILNRPLNTRAQYHAFNVTSGSDCIRQDYRSPNIPPGIYDAIHEENVTSSDGGAGYFYGGFTQQNPGTLVQYVCWPATGGFAPYSQQIPIFAGTNMVGYPQIGEGSSCAIKGYWPQFTTNLWTREAVRYWLPANGTPHLGYQGMWIKEPVSGNWYHVGTFLYPFAVTGVTGMSGWQENFSGYTGIYIVDHAGGYYHRNGQWNMANQISYTSGSAIAYASLINTNTATESQVANTNLGNNYPITLTMSAQPSTPSFDPIVVSNATATLVNTQLLVQWQMPLASSPQLGYLVEVFTNAAFTGSPAVSFFDNDPEARGKLLSTAGIGTPFARLTISDIFFNTNTPVLITPTTVAPTPATNVAGTVSGLNFQYYESTSGDWGALPNFSALTPVYLGSVNYPDVTPRRQRTNYGFNFNGYLTVPATGLYNFTLHSGDGSILVIDGTTVVNFDGLHDSSQFMSGGLALAAGPHAFNLRFFKGAANAVNTTAYTDGLGLAWEGPGIAKNDIPASAFSRVPGSREPAVTLNSPNNNATLAGNNPGLLATVVTNGNTMTAVRFYLTDYSSYYARPSGGVDYYIGQSSNLPYGLNSMIWTAPTNLVHARLVYNGTNMIDSPAASIVTTNSSLGNWTWSPLEMHNYPSGLGIQGNTLSLLGDGMNFLSRQVNGNCILMGRLAGITPNVAGPDGVLPGSTWRAGIIFRGTTNATIGQPLGDGTTTRFAALFSAVGGGTYFENDTMRDGNGDANAWSGDLGGGNQWYKIQRIGDQFTSSVSSDGVNWSVVSTTNLTGIGTTIYAGVFIHAIQSFNPDIHSASFDSFSLMGTNVVGPPSVAISPLTNSVIGGLSATFSASVIGPAPLSYQWQLNGTNIPNATNASLTIPSVAVTNVGSYTVEANGVTSAPAILIVSSPAGSGVWTNVAGGSWTAPGNWLGGLIAGGTDALANFSTLSLSSNSAVTLDGSRTIGSAIFDDLNPGGPHNWILNTGAGGSLNLATSSETPNLTVKSGTNIINTVVTGSQGFEKSGAGYLELTGAGTYTGTVSVNEGTLEVQAKSGDTPYTVAQGATLKIGYSTGGGYASTGLTIDGNGAGATSGFYLAGGQNYNASGEIILSGAPTTVRQYGTGFASIGIFDINGTGLWCSSAASGSVLDPNIAIISLGYGMAVQVDAGTNTVAGDLTINGPLNVGSLGFYKRGGGSLHLNATAGSGNTAVQIQSGTVICGTNNCLGTNAALLLSSGATLNVNGFNQAIAATSGAGTTTLSGTLLFPINATMPANGVLAMGGTSPLVYGGSLLVTNIGATVLGAGESFTLFNAASYSGAFTRLSLPVLPVGLIWVTSNLTVNGTISISTNGQSVWTGGGTDGKWDTAGNWGGTAPLNGQSLTFQGTTRPANTNNSLSAAGQVFFENGGFAIGGNPLALEWGLVNESGNNAWTIGTVLTGAQSFLSTNGTLTVSGAITNAGHGLSLDGTGSNVLSGIISGTGVLVKNGSGGALLSNVNTSTGGTLVNAGLLNLAGASGGSGTLAGPLTVNGGGTVVATAVNALGYSGNSWVTTLNILGGTFITSANGDQGWDLTVNMMGGALTASGTGAHFSAGGGWKVNTLATNMAAVISGNVVLRESNPNNQLVFNVASGSASPDLLVSSVISQNASGYGIVKNGAGVMSLTGASSFTGPTTVSGGTLLVNSPGSLASGSALTVAPGATLGGTGTINGPVTNNGTLAPGNLGIGRLTINNNVLLSGNAVMKVSQNSGTTTNDQVVISGRFTEGGQLTVTNIGPSAPTAGDSFKIFTAGSFTGSFTNLILPTLTTGLQWSTNTLATSGTIAVSNILCTLTYVAGANGTINGSTLQTVVYGGGGTTVTAVPAATFYFASWSDGSLANPRTDVEVTNSLQVKATFAPLKIPLITSAGFASGRSSFTVAGTGNASQPYVLWAASNLTTGAWTPVLTNLADTNGGFQFADLWASNYLQRFYQVQAQ